MGVAEDCRRNEYHLVGAVSLHTLAYLHSHNIMAACIEAKLETEIVNSKDNRVNCMAGQTIQQSLP